MSDEKIVAVYRRAQSSPEFEQLRARLRNFVLPISAAFLAWYVVYVLLATYAVELMSTKVWGNVNLGLIIGLGQFVTTFVITAVYVRFANRTIDPIATELRESLEAEIAEIEGEQK